MQPTETHITTYVDNLQPSFTGRFLYQCLPYRRKIIHQNIQQVFSDVLTLSQQKKLAQLFYSHLATSLKEIIQLRFMREKTLRERVEVRGYEHVLAVSAKNKGVLILTGHFGNWEFAPIGGILNFKAFQGHFHFIRRTLGAKWIERLLFRRYYAAGLQVIPKKNSLDQVCQALEKNHAVVFVLDQHASLVNRDGIAVEFFGKKAGTYRSLATLSGYTDLPVIPAATYRLPNGNHVLEFYAPIPWKDYGNHQASLYHNTLAYNQALEKIILNYPEQWHWLHKRWKLASSSI